MSSDSSAYWTEELARWWQEGFTQGADAEYEEQILPLLSEHLSGSTQVLDVGCGEGQVSRLAAGTRGVTTAVGIDPAWPQLREARTRGGGVALARASGEALPFRSGAFDAVVACLVFEHIPDLDTALAEVSRLLRTGGRFILLMNHPLLQTPGSGWIDDTILEEQYWRVGPYLWEDESMEEVDKGVTIPFMHRPLSRYVNAMAASGMYVVHMDEPAPPPGFLARAEEYQGAVTIPRLMALVAIKHAL